MENWKRCVGRDASGKRRVYGQGLTYELAELRAREAARDYANNLMGWRFEPASEADMFAVQFARD